MADEMEELGTYRDEDVVDEEELLEEDIETESTEIEKHTYDPSAIKEKKKVTPKKKHFKKKIVKKQLKKKKPILKKKVKKTPKVIKKLVKQIKKRNKPKKEKKSKTPKKRGPKGAQWTKWSTPFQPNSVLDKAFALVSQKHGVRHKEFVKKIKKLGGNVNWILSRFRKEERRGWAWEFDDAKDKYKITSVKVNRKSHGKWW